MQTLLRNFCNLTCIIARACVVPNHFNSINDCETATTLILTSFLNSSDHRCAIHDFDLSNLFEQFFYYFLERNNQFCFWKYLLQNSQSRRQILENKWTIKNDSKKREKRKIFFVWQSVTQMNESGAALLYAIRVHYNTRGWRTSARWRRKG